MIIVIIIIIINIYTIAIMTRIIHLIIVFI